MAEFVGTTLGPRSHLVAIDEGYKHTVLKDGVSVARAMESDDEIENLAIKIMREAAQKQLDSCGDGTTAVTLLAQSIYSEAQTMISSGTNPMALRSGLEEAVKEIIAGLDKIKKPVKTEAERIAVATISASDNVLGELIAGVLDKKDIVVTVEESKTAETFVDFQEGMMFDRGFISPYFITEPDRQEATVENCLLLVSDMELNDIMSVKTMIDEMVRNNEKNLVIIAPSIGGSALSSFILTKMNGGMSILCIGAPLFGELQKNFLQDICILTGATLITQEAGLKFENVTIDELGRVDRITSTKNSTVIVGGSGIKKDITKRIALIKKQIGVTESAFEREKMKERLARLSGGVAVIKVGGQTEVEMNERKERAEDAVASTQAAIEDGIVPGGEYIYWHLSRQLGNWTASRILKNALKKPFEKLVSNSGLSLSEILIELNGKPLEMGLDVTDGKIKNMFEAGIIDPTKVLKEAVRNAVSVAIQLMSIDAVIITKPEKDALPRLR
jgi:chaperonin GroEL